MERIWRLLVAVFFLVAAIALALLAWLFEGTFIAGICVYAILALIPIGLVKGLYNVFHFGSAEDKKQE